MNILNYLTEIEKDKLKTITYKTNDIIYNEGDLCNHIGIIIEGSIKISTISYLDKEEIIKILSENDIFGENIIFLDNNVYLGDIIALKKTTITYIDRNQLTNLLQLNKIFLIEYLKFIGQQAFNTTQKVKLLSQKAIRDRIIYYINQHYENNYCYIKNVSLLSKELSLPRPSVSRELSNLERDKIIKRDINRIYLLKKLS